MKSESEPMELEDFVGWVLGGIAAVFTALTAAVTTLWNRSEKKNADAIAVLQKRAEDCESDRSKLWLKLADIEEKNGH